MTLFVKDTGSITLIWTAAPLLLLIDMPILKAKQESCLNDTKGGGGAPCVGDVVDVSLVF